MTLAAQSGLKHQRDTRCVRQKGRLSFLYSEDALTAGAMVTVTERAIRVRRLPILKN